MNDRLHPTAAAALAASDRPADNGAKILLDTLIAHGVDTVFGYPGGAVLPLYDARVQENPAYTTVVLLSRVITSLGTLGAVTQSVVENMFASDVAFLQDFYRRINAEGHTRIAVTCPQCSHRFTADLGGGRLGES